MVRVVAAFSPLATGQRTSLEVRFVPTPQQICAAISALVVSLRILGRTTASLVSSQLAQEGVCLPNIWRVTAAEYPAQRLGYAVVSLLISTLVCHKPG